MTRLLGFGAGLRTVDVSWCLSACCAEPQGGARVGALRYRLADLLVATFNGKACIFPYRTGAPRGLRGHVASFADQVYPILALSKFHRLSPGSPVLDVARRAADRICGHQLRGGQWPWHYDARNGRVIEPYPVYSVHQDAMAPLALHALVSAGGPSCQAHIDRGLEWLRGAEELDGASLIDLQAGVVWRKVARREPGKLTRTAQALAARSRPGRRLAGADVLFPPRRIDRECRPYHFGWFYAAWARQLAGCPAADVEAQIA